MEYPINENSQYPLIRKCVEKMFASRTKPMSEKTIEIWAEEIIMRNFSKEAIEKGTREFVENEDYNLSLPIVLKLISGKMTYKLQHDKNCPFSYTLCRYVSCSQIFWNTLKYILFVTVL